MGQRKKYGSFDIAVVNALYCVKVNIVWGADTLSAPVNLGQTVAQLKKKVSRLTGAPDSMAMYLIQYEAGVPKWLNPETKNLTEVGVAAESSITYYRANTTGNVLFALPDGTTPSVDTDFTWTFDFLRTLVTILYPAVNPTGLPSSLILSVGPASVAPAAANGNGNFLELKAKGDIVDYGQTLAAALVASGDTITVRVATSASTAAGTVAATGADTGVSTGDASNTADASTVSPPPPPADTSSTVVMPPPPPPADPSSSAGGP